MTLYSLEVVDITAGIGQIFLFCFQNLLLINRCYSASSSDENHLQLVKSLLMAALQTSPMSTSGCQVLMIAVEGMQLSSIHSMLILNLPRRKCSIVLHFHRFCLSYLELLLLCFELWLNILLEIKTFQINVFPTICRIWYCQSFHLYVNLCMNE